MENENTHTHNVCTGLIRLEQRWCEGKGGTVEEVTDSLPGGPSEPPKEEAGSTVQEAESRGERRAVGTETQHGKGMGCEACTTCMHVRNGE